TDVYADPDDRRVFLEVLKKAGSVYSYPIVFKARNGTRLHIVASSHYFSGADGTVQGVEGVLHDVTELHLAQEALKAANNKLNLLSSITRHDIKNQLMALDGFIQLSSRAITEPEKLRDFFLREEKIAKTIERQIDFTRDYENLGVKDPVWQDVAMLVQVVSAHLPVQDIHLTIDCRGIEIYADPLLEKVFYNLIDNSLHYGGETMTALQIAAEPEGDTLRLIYADDGGGISAADKEKLFTKGFGKHTGLGLFLSREILAITGITIRETGEPGRGARFEITVPEGGWRQKQGPA
ncbi:MAG: PAS domain-containing sensor histidine kinase, partial [Methanomicrobiales archaeon]|nr:PAS domain-containing sensor histidine kinase [Methanomicrobiales archaeon]